MIIGARAAVTVVSLLKSDNEITYDKVQAFWERATSRKLPFFFFHVMLKR